jgi:hypothetical protein
MAEEVQQKQFDLIAKADALLDVPVLSKLMALGFYCEFVLRHFYGTSFGNFNTFAALRDFATGLKPLSLALVIAGAALVPRAGFIVWRLLLEVLYSPAYYFRKEDCENYARYANAGEVMHRIMGKELARRKKDDYLLKDCEALEEEERKICVTKINVAAVFSITALNLLLRHQGQEEAGLIMHGLALQITWLLATAIYAGIPTSEHYSWVSVPEGYTEEEIHPTERRRVTKSSVLSGSKESERPLPERVQPQDAKC